MSNEPLSGLGLERVTACLIIQRRRRDRSIGVDHIGLTLQGLCEYYRHLQLERLYWESVLVVLSQEATEISQSAGDDDREILLDAHYRMSMIKRMSALATQKLNGMAL